MCSPPFQVVSLLFLLPALPAAAQSVPAAAGIELPPQQGQGVPGDLEIAVAPGRPLFLFFDAALDQAAVLHASRALGLQRVAVGEDTLAFQLAPGLREGTRLRLPVRFADGQPPRSMSLSLVVDSPRAQGHVTVPRHPRGAQACEGALLSARARVVALDAELATLKQELQDRAGSLTELAATGVLTSAGVRVVELPAARFNKRLRNVKITAARLYVARGRMAVEVEVDLTSDARWAHGPPKLTLQGRPVAVRSVRLLRESEKAARLLVEWLAPEADPERSPPPYALEITDERGRATLRASCLGSEPCRAEGKPWKK